MRCRYVALLRGVNVGRAKRVSMNELRGLIESLGYSEVSTLLNSGNVGFSAPEVETSEAAARIESALAAELGVRAPVVVLTAEQVTAAVTLNPFATIADNPSRLLVAFLAESLGASKLDALEQRDWAPEAFAVRGEAAYLWCPRGVASGPLFGAVIGALGDAVTTRNWATVVKLQALLESAG